MIGQSGYLSPAGTKDNTQLVPYGGKQKCQTRRKLCHEWGGNVLQWRILSGYLSHTCYFWGFPAPSSLHWMRQFNIKANICNVKLSFRLHRILLFFFLGRHALTWTLTSNIWQLARALRINTAVHFLFGFSPDSSCEGRSGPADLPLHFMPRFSVLTLSSESQSSPSVQLYVLDLCPTFLITQVPGYRRHAFYRSSIL